MFEPVQPVWDPPALEHRWLRQWRERGTLAAYLQRNDQSSTQFSFIDGPITANNPMGIHHAWGRTIKDLVQRYHTMLGQKQRYQNGFDCQGLWVEVEVEKELGFNSKRDIEAYGIDKFVERCKERVLLYSRVQTDQSIRLGYFMDWDHSYYTMSDENNYTIWGMLKKCHEHGWIDRGHDVMPWCPRCATALSNMEIATEGYQEITHDSVYVRLPLRRRPGEYLLVWTTTPWTLSSNVAVAVNPELTYVKVRQGDAIYYLSKGAVKTALHGRFTVLQELQGEEMLGWSYEGPFDDLKVIRDALRANEQTQGPTRDPESRREIVDGADVPHWVIAWDDVGDGEGTGIVHIAPGCGREDYQLGRRELLPAPAPINEFGTFVDDYGWLTGMHVRDVAEPIFQELKSKGMLYRAAPYLHRYPVCWRCGSELVFRLVDEWYIRLDELRPRIMDVSRHITWIPSFGLDRELDWLRNMDDWMISKKRYWGLALPFYPCTQCGNLDVLGGKEELYERAIGGVHDLPSPHRPWIDAIKIRCSQCGAEVSRIADVGNPWLDAGIVPFSTLDYQHDKAHWRQWFPADFITESFPGQYRNWFYSLLTMATVLEDRPPFKTVLGHANVHDENGEEMHKSKGNSISFDEAADRAGANVIRWTYMGHPPAVQMNFGYRVCDETRRRLLTLWNVYRFFVDYARIDSFDPSGSAPALAERTPLDRWVLARLHQTIDEVRSRLDQYDMPPAVRAIEAFIDDVSTWYVRRGRRRYWKPGADADKLAAYHTLYDVLVTVTKLIAPFMPFLAEELHDNLVAAPETGVQSVHLQDYPVVDPSLVDQPLLRAMASVQKVVELGRADRAKAGLKVRQSLPRVLVALPSDVDRTWFATLERHVSEELNVKLVEVVEEAGAIHDASIKPRMGVLGPRYGKDFPRLLTALREHPHTVHADGGATVGGYHLKPDEIEIIARPHEGLAVTEGDGFVVALDTSVTPDLEAEGHARDLVRRIQMMRKEAGLEIQDRIALSYDAELELASAIAQYGAYIKDETLALELHDGIEPDAAGAFAWSGEIAGEPVRLALVKATSAREA